MWWGGLYFSVVGEVYFSVLVRGVLQCAGEGCISVCW